MGTVEKIISSIVSFFFHIGIFEVLGIQYESWTSILLFIGLSFVADAVTKVLFIFMKARYFLATDQHFNQYHNAIFRILLDFIAVHLIDEWMTSVHFSIFSEIGFVLIIYLIDTSLFRNGEKDSES
ncbi:YrvL family regulatory protein [Paenibacillus sp. chi10]|uniref:YrvL family regulatory protein n=1 Tax=Paenibacillus suaedae TaxID=3077233 RepID=A0AAJ2JXW3_9BACL|nr:YrvL family regulatory protein [Paenibacillus sp. chi10]MDT8976434.1 YrvL family regulatory protein [Paenibacillus sp. chi10]